MNPLFRLLAASTFLLLASVPLRADDVVLQFDDVREDGLVVAEVDLTAAARWCGIEPVVAERICAAEHSGAIVQFVPDADFDARERVCGVLVARLPKGGSARVPLQFRPSAGDPGMRNFPKENPIGRLAIQDPKKQAGLPTGLAFPGEELKSVRWEDRLYRREMGAYRIEEEPGTQLRVIADGPLCHASRMSFRFVGPGGKAPESEPEAVYQWIELPGSLVYLTAMQRQQQPFEWKEAHFLELHLSADELPHWAGGNPVQKGGFEGADKSQRFHEWAAMHDGCNAVALLRSGEMTIYDGKGGYGPYLHAHSSEAWKPWAGTERRLAAWLWIGGADDPLKEIAAAAAELPTQARVMVTVDRVQKRIEEARVEAARLEGDAQRQAHRAVAVAASLEKQGRFQEALDAVEGSLPEGMRMLVAGDLSLLFEATGTGIRALHLLDAATGIDLFTPQPLPLFSLTLRRSGTTDDVQVEAGDGWSAARVESLEGDRVKLSWSGAGAEGLDGLDVECVATLDPAVSAVRWTLRAKPPADWILRNVVFPQVTIADLGKEGDVVFPRGSGEVQRDLWRRPFRYSGPYPAGWTAMQWLAAYDEARRTGLYIAMHDPGAATKEIEVESRPAEHAVAFTFEHPPAGMDRPGQTFQLPGESVWQIFRGNWFDAAQVYREWVRREAEWWPALGPDGREDTPLWMRELPVWALVSGSPKSVVPQVKKFAEALGVPVGVHWYNWHQIPFDNDYPHYFPTLEGFAEGVAELQRCAPSQARRFLSGERPDVSKPSQ